MECPGGHLFSIYARFSGKRELQYIFLGKNVIIITPKHGTTIYFSHYNIFLGTIREKSTCKARYYWCDASISDRAQFNMAAVSVKRSIESKKVISWLCLYWFFCSFRVCDWSKISRATFSGNREQIVSYISYRSYLALTADRMHFPPLAPSASCIFSWRSDRLPCSLCKYSDRQR